MAEPGRVPLALPADASRAGAAPGAAGHRAIAVALAPPVSNLEPHPTEATCGGTADVPAAPVRELLYGRDVVLGGTRGMPVTRTLPNKHRRMVGAWCFVDHYQGDVSMRVPPHPHIALQTVTWLVQGEVRHRDSLGNDQLIRPGQLNLMTAGRGIAHAEDSTSAGPMPLHGVQLWVALPSSAVELAPAFAHHAELPSLVDGAVVTRLLVGSTGGVASPAQAHTPIFGAEVFLAGQGSTELRLEPDFEYAVLTLAGDSVTVDGETLPYGPLLYLGTGRRSVSLTGPPGGRVLIIGGEPFAEEMIMWWNFIGRSHDEIVAARESWLAGDARFGPVDYEGPRLPAPDLPITPMIPKGRTR
jgi:redox-sensitive bicupin YhaK (pirin superfamily)